VFGHGHSHVAQADKPDLHGGTPAFCHLSITLFAPPLYWMYECSTGKYENGGGPHYTSAVLDEMIHPIGILGQISGA
jgi:hypothetical protein